ncbi:hypothetical protein LOK49_LG12G01427 [Camellia lanceoleosa]|uniref:Uncharacterized protein n=1 Tax=Camellia lanceoleosa TaxID=1840588 RepID=A0ACC0FUI0_9ERIC|nr:hypothetical protein LOK49_LG12G01427 [Camellia lanceoleosa]
MKEKQAADIVDGFILVFKVKDDQIKKVVEENVDLRKTIGVLEEQLAEQDVHNLTQAFRTVDDGCTDRGDGKAVGIKDRTTLDIVGLYGNNRSTKADNCGGSNDMTGGVLVEISQNDSDVVEVGRCMPVGQRVECVQKSFVRNLKCKVRKELRLPKFEYYGVGNLRMGCNVVGDNKVVDVVRSGMGRGRAERVIDVDAFAVRSREWSGFALNNQLGVWKMMTEMEKEKIRDAYNKDEDRPVIWASSGHDMCVYFADIKSLVQPSSLYGNITNWFTILKDTILEIQRAAVAGLGDDDAMQIAETGVEAIIDCP